jgi:plasmid stability protein
LANTQLLVRLPEGLAQRFRQRAPPRQRSAFVQRLLEQALQPTEDDDDPLYLAALEVEREERLMAELSDCGVTVGDGLSTEESAAPQP